MASNNVFNKLKKKELTEEERTEMKEKFADVSIVLGIRISNRMQNCKSHSVNHISIRVYSCVVT